eukprot:4654739-Prymnesium_polylepis.1
MCVQRRSRREQAEASARGEGPASRERPAVLQGAVDNTRPPDERRARPRHAAAATGNRLV